MSRGPGKLQRAVFDVLASAGRSLKTAELCEELVTLGLTSMGENRKSDVAKVLRACHGLVERGVISMDYDVSSAGQWSCSWKAMK